MTPVTETFHPHDIEGQIPDRLPGAELRRLSVIDSRMAALCIGSEWAMIVSAIAVAAMFPHAPVIVAAIAFIGARQQALTVIAHDASHFRLFPNRLANDLSATFCWLGRCSFPSRDFAISIPAITGT